MPLGNPSPFLSRLLANAGLIPYPRVLLILGCHINGITVNLVLLLHVEITFNLLIVLLNVPLGAGFSSFPQVEVSLIFFYLTQPLPHAGISSTLVLIIMFRWPRSYQLSVKSSQECESTSDEGGGRSLVSSSLCLNPKSSFRGLLILICLISFPSLIDCLGSSMKMMTMVIVTTIVGVAAVNFS